MTVASEDSPQESTEKLKDQVEVHKIIRALDKGLWTGKKVKLKTMER